MKFRAVAAVIAGWSLLISAQVGAVTISVANEDDVPVVGFKWLIEEDNTHPPEPGVSLTPAADVQDRTLALSMHRSHAPTVASGEEISGSSFDPAVAVPGLDPNKRYFVSVLPFGNHSSCDLTYDMGGVSFSITDTEAKVWVKQNPIETAQFSVKVFHDIAPLNNAPDALEIAGVAAGAAANIPIESMEGFTVTLSDAGGDIVADAYGNPLGTTYQEGGSACDPVVDQIGAGDFVLTEADNGEIIIKNLAPNKYGVQVEPPGADCITSPAACWRQVTTIEGSKTIDAWVRPNEPEQFTEFGGPQWHAFFGFTKLMADRIPDADGGATGSVTGTIHKGHLPRPPELVFYPGAVPEAEAVGERCLVGLNTLGTTGFDEAIWVGQCDDGTGTFATPELPVGDYQLVVWDIALLHIITQIPVTIPPGGGAVDLGPLSTPMWFGIFENYVFADTNRNGVRDAGEAGVPEQNVNIRFRDGTIYQAAPTDSSGFVPFQAVFPWFHWVVPEVDFARLQATGLTIVTDEGGPVSDDSFGEGKRNPQSQPESGGGPSRTETGTVLTQGIQLFAGLNTRFEWGKAPYPADVNSVITDAGEAAYFASAENWIDEFGNGIDAGDVDIDGDGDYQANGGISGVVLYGVTRAENDPRFAAGEEWESGVPRVQVNLYRDVWCYSTTSVDTVADTVAVFPLCAEATPGEVGDGVPDDKNGNDLVDLADVDNYPLGWAPDNCEPPESCAKGDEDIDHNNDGTFDLGDAILVTWTDSWDDNVPTGCTGDNVQEVVVNGVTLPIEDCTDNVRTWSQSRPALFDGGYAFGPGEPLMVSGTYIVEAATPPGYEIVKEEDRNVDFGITPTPAILPAKCVGDDHTVPQLLSFLTRADGVALPGVVLGDEDNHAPFAGEDRPLCDRKKVDLGGGQNTAADFFVFTDVPKAARGVGFVNDDLGFEADPNRPAFSEKYTPPWVNIAVYDYTGREINRTSGDEFGAYNFLAPSSYNINLPTPTGVGPKMHQFCMNHPIAFGDINDKSRDGIDKFDPSYDARYGTTCYTFNFETARTTYLDTPVIRQAAFVGAQPEDLSCQKPSGFPEISSVRVGSNWGPVAKVNDSVQIYSVGLEEELGLPTVADAQATPVTYDRGFGSRGAGSQICLEHDNATGPEGCDVLRFRKWGNGRISFRVPESLGSLVNGEIAANGLTGQLHVTNNNGNRTNVGLTFTVLPSDVTEADVVERVPCLRRSGICRGDIQAAIDAADAGDIVLVEPGSYQQLLVINKPIKLQGSGAGGTRLLGSPFPFASHVGSPLDTWQATVDSMSNLGAVPTAAPTVLVTPTAGVFNTGLTAASRPRIDGFHMLLNSQGGAVHVAANAVGIQISNNKIAANQGSLAGGIQVGAPLIADNNNPSVVVRNNIVRQNGSFNTGGGIGIYGGADQYSVSENFVCGNIARTGGGGIAHRGLSDDGAIVDNEVLFNELTQGGVAAAGEGLAVNGGGGIEISGIGLIAEGVFTQGSGSVRVEGNLVQGNQSAVADGGGIALNNVNGQDLLDGNGNPEGDTNQWHQIDIVNNFIVNNVTGVAGAGISLQDAPGVNIVHNTVANNDSTATGAAAFVNGIGQDTIRFPAGISSRPNSVGLQAALGGAIGFSNPLDLRRNLVTNNRSYFFAITAAPPALSAPEVWDHGVTNGANCLSPVETQMTELVPGVDPANCNYTGSSDNGQLADPGFVASYVNVYDTGVAADEGGNFVQALFSPLGVQGDYHLETNSGAIDQPGASGAPVLSDIDGEVRPAGANPDTGADEVQL